MSCDIKKLYMLAWPGVSGERLKKSTHRPDPEGVSITTYIYLTQGLIFGGSTTGCQHRSWQASHFLILFHHRRVDEDNLRYWYGEWPLDMYSCITADQDGNLSLLCTLYSLTLSGETMVVISEYGKIN